VSCVVENKSGYDPNSHPGLLFSLKGTYYGRI
jgi:hypothetical protein